MAKIIIGLILVLWTGPAFGADALRIGATVSQTGHFATEVGPFKKLIAAWENSANANGGVVVAGRRLALRTIVYDDRSDEATARRMYERLALVDKVHLMIGPYSSPLTFASAGVAETHRVPFVAVCANSPKIYNRGHQWIVCIIDEAPRYTYRYWEMIKAEARARTAAFVVEDSLHPRAVADGAATLATQAGLKVVSSHIGAADNRDFAPIVVALKQQDPDIVLVAANIPFAVQFVAQAKELGLSPRQFHVIHHGGVFRRALGTAAEAITGQSYWTKGMTRGQHRRFEALLAAAAIDVEDYPWSPAYMMAFEAIEAALAAAKTGLPEDVMASLKALDADTIGGTVRFAPNGVGTINTFPSQIQNGRYQIVWPPEVATGRHVYHGASGN